MGEDAELLFDGGEHERGFGRHRAGKVLHCRPTTDCVVKNSRDTNMAEKDSLLPIINLVWMAGWIVSSLIYVLFVKLRSTEARAPSSWLPILSRILLMGIFWPIVMLLVPFVFRPTNPSKRRARVE